MLHFGKGDGTVAAVHDGHRAPIRLQYAALGFGAADAQVVVTPFLEQAEILFCGNTGINDDHHLLVGMGWHGISGNDAVHHTGQRFGIGSVSGKDGGVAYEALRVDGQRKHQQTAVGALLLGAAEFGLGGGTLAPLEVEVCQVVEYHAVGDIEEGVGACAQVTLQLVLERMERWRGGTYFPLGGHIAEVTREELHGSRVLFHDTQGLPFRRRIDGPHHQRGERSMDAAFAPAFTTQELIYL